MDNPDQAFYGAASSSPEETLGEDADPVKALRSNNLEQQGLTQDQTIVGGQDVRAKLRDLQVERQRIDGEIASLKSALRIIGDDAH